ncbi:MAG: amidase, partial [Candidatus Dormibacteraeota bacterium]|nr:amidase [Candidatus Dormibacteraeota bacterium]
MPTDLEWATASELAGGIRAGRVKARDLLEAQIERTQRWNPLLNAIVANDFTGARVAADRADITVQRGMLIGPLHGLAISVKDTIDVEGMSSTAGSATLAGRVAAQDAESVRRLKSAGAIIAARSNTPAFANDAQCVSDLYGRTNNPWDIARTSGGSSGGAAAAVAAGLTPFELGSDMGGSVRLPAHFCGVAAHKPTEGLVPNQGHMPPPPGRPAFPDALNVIGPIARSVADLRLLLKILAGHPVAVIDEDRRPRHEASSVRLGWSADGVSASSRTVRQALEQALLAAGEAGFKLRELPPGSVDLAGAGALHARIVEVCDRAWFGGPEPSFGEVVELMGERQLFAQQVDTALAEVDAWMLPVAPIGAPAHTLREEPIDVDGT